MSNVDSDPDKSEKAYRRNDVGLEPKDLALLQHKPPEAAKSQHFKSDLRVHELHHLKACMAYLRLHVLMYSPAFHDWNGQARPYAGHDMQVTGITDLASSASLCVQGCAKILHRHMCSFLRQTVKPFDVTGSSTAPRSGGASDSKLRNDWVPGKRKLPKSTHVCEVKRLDQKPNLSSQKVTPSAQACRQYKQEADHCARGTIVCRTLRH
jgi:hypothetical protein